jgi:hypothetical protein
MSKKSDYGAKKGALTDRIRQVAERKAPPAFQPPPPPPRPKQQRQDRRVLFREGYVILESGQKVRVVIKNLSNTGARVEFFSQTMLPEEVVLSEPILKLRRQARVIWQREGVAGLRFVGE